MLDQVVAALAEVLVSIELAPDEAIDTDFAASLQGEVASVFDTLTNEERSELAQIIGRLVEAEKVPERRAVLSEIPDAYGLLDDE